MRSKIATILIVLFFINPISLITTVANDKEVVATLGENHGSLNSTVNVIWYVFYGNQDIKYKFSLEGPIGTNFDYYIENSEGRIIRYNEDDYYPKETSIFGLDEYHIRIFAGGTGDFTLTIIALELDKVQFADSLENAVYVWEVTDKKEISFFDGIHDEDRIRLEILENLGFYFYYGDINLDEAINLELNDEPIVDDELRWELFQFLLIPISVTLNDSTSLIMVDMLNGGWMDSIPIKQQWNEQTTTPYVVGGGSERIDSKWRHTFSTTFLMETGILRRFDLEINELDNEEQPINEAHFSIELAEDDSVTPNGDGPGIFADDSPVNPLWCTLGLVAIPILKRKKS